MKIRITEAILVTLMALAGLPAAAQMMIGHMGHGGHNGCTIATGPFPLGLAVYKLADPGQGQDFGLEGHCSHIPDPGNIRVAIDFQTPQPRDMPLALRLVKTDDGEKEIISVPAKRYINGVVNLETRLEQTGQYDLLLDFAQGGGTAATQVHIPLHVGGGGGGHGTSWLAIGLTLLAAGAAYVLWESRRRTPRR